MAVGWLERTRATGFFRDAQSLALLDTDPDLDALRALRAFRLLRLDAGFPTDPFRRSP